MATGDSRLNKTPRTGKGEVTVTRGSPFNLSDVVPFRKADPAETEPTKAVKAAMEWAGRANDAKKLRDVVGNLGEGNRGEYATLDGLFNRWHQKATDTAMGVLASDGYVPESLRKSDSLNRLANLPTVDMAELRRVVDVLDMTIMPWAYLKPASYERESYELKSAIEQFVADTKPAFNVYVAAPVQYYDASLHVAAEEDQPIFAGHHVAPAFLAMGMALPMFRAITRDLAAIRDRTNAHTQRIHQAEQQIQQLDSRVTQLQAQVERQQAEQIQQNLRQAKLESDLRAAEARASFMAYEPMMVAIPKGRTVLDNGHAIVGPCWGPDFDAIVMVALNLRKYEGQRETLKAAIKPFQSSGYNSRRW